MAQAWSEPFTERLSRVLESAQHHLQHAKTDAEKVDYLVESIAPVQKMEAAGALDDLTVRKSGIPAAEFFAACAYMRAIPSQLMGLAREHGVEEQVQRVLAAKLRELGMPGAAWGSDVGGTPLAAPTCSNPAATADCSGAAKLVCSRCRLVAYCSPECQKQHYKSHKADCKSPLADPAFVPAWLREQRRPSFVSASGPGRTLEERIAFNSRPREFLWGNTPAFSLIPTPSPPAAAAGASLEKGMSCASPGAVAGAAPSTSSTSSTSSSASSGTSPLLSQPEAHICFAASGDLRNVIATLNSLDPGYQGKLVVHVNDRDSAIMARNFAMLLLLGKVGPAAADAVIHLWYSTALTEAQRERSKALVCRTLGLDGRGPMGDGPMQGKLLQDDGTCSAVTLNDVTGERPAGYVSFHLSAEQGGSSAGGASSGGSAASGAANGSQASGGASAALLVDFPGYTWVTLVKMLFNTSGVEELMGSRSAVIHAARELDKRDRWIHSMEPYHRVCWAAHYEQGLLLPFGATSAHHCAPNTLLFNPDLGYTLGAGSDPLHGWPVHEVMASGGRHHVPTNDLYGALFFYLRDQLTDFATRMATLDVEFRLTCLDAQELAPRLQQEGVMLDFIDTSNIADPNYCGINQVLQDWGPLLNWRANPAATLVTLFMNWLADMPEVDQSVVPKRQVKPLMWEACKAMKAGGELPAALFSDVHARSGPGGRPSDEGLNAMAGLSSDMYDRVKERFDYSGLLLSYLTRKGAFKAASAVGLRPRGTPHRIRPPRFFVLFDAALDALPFQGWSPYQRHLAHRFTGSTLVERYVEWVGGSSS